MSRWQAKIRREFTNGWALVRFTDPDGDEFEFFSEDFALVLDEPDEGLALLFHDSVTSKDFFLTGFEWIEVADQPFYVRRIKAKNRPGTVFEVSSQVSVADIVPP